MISERHVISQDTVQFTETTQQDSLSTSSDSLDKLLPYLDQMKSEADSKNELILIYALVILLSTWFSEDLACIGAGILVANNFIGFWPASLAAISGIYIGDLAFYIGGRILGTSILEIAPFKWFIKKEAIEKTIGWFHQKGPVLLVVSRFIPGSRIPVYLSAGILKTSFLRFLLYFGGTTLIWTPVFVWISVIAGNEILRYYDSYEDYAILIFIIGGILLWGLFRLVIPLFTKRGRRIFKQRFNRIFRSK